MSRLLVTSLALLAAVWGSGSAAPQQTPHGAPQYVQYYAAPQQHQQQSGGQQYIRVKDTVQEQVARAAVQQQAPAQQHSAAHQQQLAAAQQQVQYVHQQQRAQHPQQGQYHHPQQVEHGQQVQYVPAPQHVQVYQHQPQQQRVVRPSAPRPTALKSPQQHQEDEPEDYDPHPSYQFGFDVKDDEFTNYQNRKETRDGDKIKGSYSVVDSDGFLRTVTYTADSKEGFKAEVVRQPTDIVVKVPTPAPAGAPLRLHQVAYQSPKQQQRPQYQYQ